MPKRFTAFAATALAAAGIILATTSPASALAPGLHHLKVNKPASVNSVYISATGGFFAPYTICRPLTPGSGWADTGQDLLDGTQLTVITFTSNDCRAGYSISRTFTIPRNDGLTNFWVNMT